MAACFFLLLSWLAVITFYAAKYQGYDYPDEAANAFFANRLADSGQFKFSTGLTPEQLYVYRPRSVGISGGDYIPGSFIGFVGLHGLLLRLGYFGPLVFTALVFGGALIAWYRIVRRYWEPPWALASVAILVTIPAVAVYQTLAWLHASLFTSLLIITSLALLRFQEKQSWARAMIIGLAYGAALFIRPIEALWTGPAIAIVMIVHKHGWRYLLNTILITLTMQLPWLIASRQIFGSPLSAGYAPRGIEILPTDEPLATGGLAWYKILIPPGGWSWQFIPAAWESLVLLLPVLSLMTVLALLIYFRRKLVQSVKILKIGAVCLLGLYYVIYYGSLDLTSPNDPVLAGVLSSYVRYWLPLHAGMAAGAVVFMRFVTSRRLNLAWPMIIILIGVNVWTSLGHFSGGLRALRRQDLRFQQLTAQIKSHTETNSLIITGRYDKALLAHRLVSFHQPVSAAEWDILKQIADRRPVYAIGSIMLGRESTWQAAAADSGLTVGAVSPMDDNTLWRLTPTQNND